MKSASSDLIAFLSTATAHVRANLYTFTLTNGDVHWFTDADIPIVVNGTTFRAAPCITDKGYSMSVGLDVDTLSLDIADDGRTLIAGVPLLAYMRAGGFDNAVVTVQRAYYQNWGLPLIGVITRFGGRFSELKDSGNLSSTVIISSWAELLNTYMPVDVYQSPCLNMLYDAKCTLDRNSFKATGSITGVTDPRQIATSIMASANIYALGVIQFTSGDNAGVTRSITAQDAEGNLTLVAPTPAPPQIGDAFNLYLGCDRSQGTCATKFNNLINFRGQPYIPAPEVAA